MTSKKWAQLFILSLGIIFVMLSFLIHRNENNIIVDINIVFLSIGCSIISVVIINYIEYLTTLPERETIKSVNTWGLKSIYETRAEMNNYTNKLLVSAKELDIAVFGAKGLINYQGNTIKERLKQKMIMRILIPMINSEYIAQREKDENAINGEITKTINDLKNWVQLTKNELGLSDNSLSIMQYNYLPIESIMRIDNDLFVGPFMARKVSQLTMAYHYHKGGKGYDYYNDYFNDIWNNSLNNNINKVSTVK